MKALLTPNTQRVVVWALAVVALVAPAILVAEFRNNPDMLAVMLWLLVPNAIAGFVLTWRWTDTLDPLGPANSEASKRWGDMATGNLLDAVVVLVIQFLGTLIIQLIGSAGWDDWRDVLTGPLLITACAGAALFLAIGIGFLVVGPMRTLGRTLVLKLSGGKVDSARPAFALMLLLIVALAVAAVLAGYTVPDRARRSAIAGFILMGVLMFTVHGTAEQQLFAWIARVLLVLLVVTIVWLFRIARRRRAGAR